MPWHLVLVSIPVLGVCEPWCTEPCGVLNGIVELECGTCDPTKTACFPGADGYGASRQPLKATGGMSGMGGMSGALKRVKVHPTGAAVASLFTLPDAPRMNASSFYAPASVEDEAAVHTAGRTNNYACDSAACARVRLQELREANAQVIGSNGHVLAGGQQVPCEFQRATREELLAMTINERDTYLTALPTVIRGLTEDWPARTLWADPRKFSARFGHHEVKAIRAAHGFGKLARLGGSGCFDFDEQACPGQQNATVSFAELVPYSADEQIVIMDLPDMVRGEHELLTDLSTEYEVPEFLESISNVRLLSLGGRPEGVQMSAHHSAWLAVIEGAKLWHLAPPNRPQPSNRYCPNRGKIDYELARREGVIHCMAYPGEVVVVPDNWWHATCNMLPYTIAVGGQTWDRSAGTQFGARGEAEKAATIARWREGRPRGLNHYQSMIEGMGLERGERLPTTAV
jgi:hypothetical protein